VEIDNLRTRIDKAVARFMSFAQITCMYFAAATAVANKGLISTAFAMLHA